MNERITNFSIKLSLYINSLVLDHEIGHKAFRELAQGKSQKSFIMQTSPTEGKYR